QACFSAIVPRDDLAAVPPEMVAAYDRQDDPWEAATAHIRRQIDELVAPTRAAAIDEVTLTYDPDTREAWLAPETQRTTEQQQLVAFSSRYVNNFVARKIRKLTGEVKAKYDQLQEDLSKLDSLKPPPLPAAMAVSDGPGP